MPNDMAPSRSDEPSPSRRRTPRITEENVVRFAEELITFYGTEDAAIKHMRSVVERRNDVGVGPDYQTTGYQVHDGTVTDHVLGTGTMMTANRPNLQLTYPGKEGQSKTEDLKAKLEPALEALVLDDAGSDGKTFARVGMSMAQDGAAWSLVTIQKHRWDHVLKVKRADFADDTDYDPFKPDAVLNGGRRPRSGEKKYVEAVERAKRRAKGLISWTYLDPRTVYPWWLGEEDLGALIVVTEHPRWMTLAEYGLTLNRDGKIAEEALGQPQPEFTVTAGETVRKIAVWTAQSVVYYLACNGSARQVETVEHGYGFIPVAWDFGWRLPHWSNCKTGWGAAAVISPNVEYVSHLKTLHANQTAGSIAPPFFREVPAGLDVVRDAQGNELKEQRVQPNTIYNGRPGEKISAFPTAQQNAHLTEQIRMEQEQIVDLRGPVATGNLSDAENGFAIESMKSAGKVKNAPFIQGAASHLTQVTKIAVRLIREQLSDVGPIYVEPRTDKASGLMTITAEDLEEEPRIFWDISPEQAAGEMVQNRGIHEQLQAGTLGPEMAITKQGNNPAEVFDDILRGEMRKDPLWREMAKSEMVSEYGRADLYARFVALQQWGETGGVAGPDGMVPPPNPPMDAVGGAMGSGGMPGDVAAQTISPGGAGATPVAAPMGIGSPVEGAPARVGVPQQAALASLQPVAQDLGQ